MSEWKIELMQPSKRHGGGEAVLASSGAGRGGVLKAHVFCIDEQHARVVYLWTPGADLRDLGDVTKKIAGQGWSASAACDCAAGIWQMVGERALDDDPMLITIVETLAQPTGVGSYGVDVRGADAMLAVCAQFSHPACEQMFDALNV